MMKDEGGRMKQSQESHLWQMKEARTLVSDFSLSIRHFSFPISYRSSSILQPLSFFLT